ncbi:MAG TPA: D-cysteine desulfhydrase family protein [Anaerolineae bacterium]|nr:D-cysteine desulfhydrase family protein [Anaerolineae bacterium]
MELAALAQRLEMLQPLPLGYLPTPLRPLLRLSQALGGPEVWIKRDDLTGLGLGGNKIRKLAFLLAEAQRQHADVIMTTGAQQSNHARQTAAVAAMLGLPCVLVLRGDPPAKPQGNYFLDLLLGAEVRWSGDRPLLQALDAEAAALRQEGRHPYVITYGGSSALGACGFVAGIAEVAMQAQALGITFDAIVFASSSGGTQAGMAAGVRALELPTRVIGISISEPASSFRPDLARLTNETAALLKLDLAFSDDDFDVRDAYLGQGYGIVTDVEREAIRFAARTEGQLVDPVYTGRALGGLMDLIRRGEFSPSQRVLFWHTGGAPALFAYTEALEG